MPLARIFSSPYRRALDTVRPLAESKRLPVVPVADLCERGGDDACPLPLPARIERLWGDLDFTFPGGECLRSVRRRNLEALRRILGACPGGSVAAGTHGLALCTMLDFFSPLGRAELERILRTTPFLVRMDLDGGTFAGMRELHLGG